MIRSDAMTHPPGTAALLGFFGPAGGVVPPILPAEMAVRPLDAAILLGYLALTVAIGLWVGRGQKDIKDYLLGDRNLPWWAVLGSIVAAETSTATVLSVPGWSYIADGDMRGLQLPIGYLVGRTIVAFVLLPQYFRGRLYTSYEVLNRRFGGATKSTASLIFLVARTIGDGLRLYLAAVPLQALLDVPLPVAIGAMGVISILYTTLGGMKSVVWNDCVQLVVYLAGSVAALLVILRALPEGWDGLVAFGESAGRMRVFDFSVPGDAGFWADPYTFLAGLIGGAFLTLGSHGTDQMTVQRLLSSRNERQAATALVLSGVVVLIQFALFLVIGIGLAAYFDAFPPSDPIAKGDEAFSRFIVTTLPVGLTGLMLAAVFAAALSSSLNSSAAAALNDLIVPRLKSEPPPERLLTWSRWLTIGFGILQTGVAILGRNSEGSVVTNVLAIASFMTGIVLGVFLLGVLTPRVSQPAALVGLVGGAAVVLFVKFAKPVAEALSTQWMAGRMPDLAWPWYAALGTLATFLIGYVASFVAPRSAAPGVPDAELVDP